MSLFNRNTFFGKTDLQIPQRDILRIEGEYAALNYYVVIGTSHGDIKFTSFLTNPVEALKEIYVGKQSRIQLNRREKGFIQF